MTHLCRGCNPPGKPPFNPKNLNTPLIRAKTKGFSSRMHHNLERPFSHKKLLLSWTYKPASGFAIAIPAVVPKHEKKKETSMPWKRGNYNSCHKLHTQSTENQSLGKRQMQHKGHEGSVQVVSSNYCTKCNKDIKLQALFAKESVLNRQQMYTMLKPPFE